MSHGEMLARLARVADRRLVHAVADRHEGVLSAHFARAFQAGLSTLPQQFTDPAHARSALERAVRTTSAAMADGLPTLLNDARQAGNRVARVNSDASRAAAFGPLEQLRLLVSELGYTPHGPTTAMFALVQMHLGDETCAVCDERLLSTLHVRALGDLSGHEFHRTAGGRGSGNYGHAGRPGEIGGSSAGAETPEQKRERTRTEYAQRLAREQGFLKDVDIKEEQLDDNTVWNYVETPKGKSTVSLKNRYGSDDPEFELHWLLAEKRGAGREALQKIVNAADTHGIKLGLWAQPLAGQGENEGFSLSKPRLEKFYKEFGFKTVRSEGRGKSKTAWMERTPKKIRSAGSASSGNYGHAGRPGQVGGSAPGIGGSSLKTASVKESEVLDGGINTTMKVTLEDGTDAIFKPEAGEVWETNFSNHDISDAVVNKDLSLAEREAMAYEVDQLAGTELVPETVHRTELEGVDSPLSNPPEEGEMDDDYLREEYDRYREKAVDSAYDKAGEEMAQLHQDAQREHAKDIEDRAQEALDIWNELKDEHPELVQPSPYGPQSALREHPVLPLGTDQGFRRQPGVYADSIDPLDVLKRADVEVSAPMNREERDNVKAILLSEMQAGVQKFGDVDMSRARSDLTYGKFVEEHADTEQKLVDQHIKSFTSWKQEQGYQGGGGSGEVRNPDAPHPNGGALQRFVPGLTTWGDMSYEKGDYQKMAVFDYLVGSMDRHGNNVFYDGNGKPLALDNGYSFPNSNEVTFRSNPTKQWMSAGSQDVDTRDMPESLRQQLHDSISKADWYGFVAKHPRMDDGEKEAFFERVNNVTEALQTPKGVYNLWRSQKLMR